MDDRVTCTNTLNWGDDCPTCGLPQSLNGYIDLWRLEQGLECIHCEAKFIDSELTTKYRSVIAQLAIRYPQGDRHDAKH